MPSPARLQRIRAAAASWEASTIVDQEAGVDGSVRQFRRAGQARAWIDWRAEQGPLLIRIESFAAPYGSRLLRLITLICDEFGVTMRAVPAPYNPRSETLPPPRPLNHLLDWYSRHGFEIMDDGSVLYDGLRRYRRRRAAAETLT